MPKLDLAQQQGSDIAILGGGMVGLSLAILLAQALPKRRIQLVESLPYLKAEPDSANRPPLYQPSFDARSSAIAWGSQQIFSDMGVWESLLQHMTAIKTVHVSDRGHVGGCKMLASEYSVPALGYVVDNSWLGACLLARARTFSNISLLAPATVTAMYACQRGYQLRLDYQGDELATTTQLAVIADGANSNLRRQVGIGHRETDYYHSALIANVAFSEPHNGVAYERFTDTGPVAILPRGSHEGALVWTIHKDQTDKFLELSDVSILEQLQDRFGQRLGRFTRIGERSLYPLKLVQANEQIRPHLVVMGNAAHSLHPVAGQGFNLSLRDCQCLAQTLQKSLKQSASLAQGDALGTLQSLQQYQQQQQSDQLITTQFSHQLPQWFTHSGFGRIALRNAGMLALELIPEAKHRLAMQSMGVTKFASTKVTR